MDEIARLYQELLERLLEQKHNDKNRDVAREIAVTITQTEISYAYFQTYVKSNLEEK